MYGCGADLCINIHLLTCLGYIPGHIHAFYLMLTRPSTRRNQPIYIQSQNYSTLPPQQGPYMPPPPQ
ncbi:uncharacterized protein BX663DRAFT_522532 [Cokeromyces recurvatus]|uniref:uncharacterized protein n=1 Tax=Cokeromyces recurvatus TaxID=90255 RepID=UPI00221F1F8A|nr:uncharacterized protein BX663DRAFT_522532 [Cokeromyces recurvatus]KAI7899170.1 hypothetical protein BX663DRAFT_522532 [Cokeromyces recurvatus]